MYFTNNLRASVISSEKYVRNYDMTFKNVYSFSLQLSRFNQKRKLSTFGLTDAVFVCMTLCVCACGSLPYFLPSPSSETSVPVSQFQLNVRNGKIFRCIQCLCA